MRCFRAAMWAQDQAIFLVQVLLNSSKCNLTQTLSQCQESAVGGPLDEEYPVAEKRSIAPAQSKRFWHPAILWRNPKCPIWHRLPSSFVRNNRDDFCTTRRVSPK
ncbi:hypothetical protein BD289DRAFT_423858, partial [Coniella lustricola]